MITIKSIFRRFAILFLCLLTMLSFVPVYAAPSVPTEKVETVNAQSPLHSIPSGKVLGINTTNRTGSSISYGITVRDIVLVIDTTAAMAYQTSGNPNTSDPGADDPALCNSSHTCQPMEAIKSAAIDFIDLLSFPSDRVGIVTMTSQTSDGSRTPIVVLSITSNKATVQTALENLNVFQPPRCNSVYGVCRNLCTADEISEANDSGDPSNPCFNKTEGYYVGQACPVYALSGNPSSCTSTDVGTSLELAGSEFSGGESRPNAQHIVIALMGSAASASVDATNTFPFGFCPSSTWNSPTSPLCRDGSSLTRHSLPDLNYDAEDYARDKADFVTNADTGLGAKVFTIGLGYLIQNASKGDPASAEKLLQYISLSAGGDTADHGSYFYASDTSALPVIFQAIADTTACSPAIIVENDHDAGAGSLRQAITDVCSGGTITFDPSLSVGAIYLASSLIVDKNLTIDGSALSSQIIISGDTDNNGTGDVPVFQISVSSTVELNNLDIVKGKGGGASGGGGIANYGTLTVENSTLSDNSYVGGIGGGGIYNKGGLTIIDSAVTGNIAEDGGGIFNEYGHTLTITGSTFSDNAAQSANTVRGGGGGIANIGTLSVDDSIFVENIAYSGGGAIVNSIDGTSTVTNSSFTGNSSSGNGSGGAINNYEGSMTIENCIFSENSDFGLESNGAAIYNKDQMNITDSTFTGNSSSSDGGGIANLGTLTLANSILSNNSTLSLGGGIVNSGNVTITNTNISGNSAMTGGGGALNQDNGVMTVESSTISNNSSDNGGGIFNLSLTGTVNISSSTIFGNSVTGGNGGGISNWGILTATNITVFDNSAAYGGGIFSLGTSTIRNSTVSGNSATTNGAGVANFGTLNYANTIIANSTGREDCYNDTIHGVLGVNINNIVENNAVSPNQCGTPSLTVDPNLGPLANNGGSTLTMSLLPGSPAIDTGDDAVCAAAPVNNASQNGVTRPQGVHCDIGSSEYIDTIAPAVLSIVRANPSPTAISSVDFTVTFSEVVTDVGSADFNITRMGVSGASISGVNGSGSIYTVTVSTGTGEGSIRLDIPASAVIKDLSNNSLNGLPYITGQTYSIKHPSIPRPPVLRSPRTNFATNDTTPTFWWARVKDGQSYEIVFATDAAFSIGVVSQVVNEPSYAVAASFSDDEYFWHVRAYNSANQYGPWSSTRSFTIDTTGPLAPQLNSPFDTVSLNLTPIFKWDAVSRVVLYEFQYDDDANFSTPYKVTTRGSFRRPPAMKPGTYYWRVCAKDSSGNWGEWSTPFAITITRP